MFSFVKRKLALLDVLQVDIIDGKIEMDNRVSILGGLISFLQWGHIVYMSVKVSYWQTFILFLKIELLLRKY